MNLRDTVLDLDSTVEFEEMKFAVPIVDNEFNGARIN